jgi:hypothetical protein
MTGVFTRTFDASLQSLSLPVEARTELRAQATRLATIAIPESLAGETRQAVRRAVEESFVRGFRVVVLIAAILALMSALFARLLISGQIQSVRAVAGETAHRRGKAIGA